ncbi:hypothetical protein LEP1GSC040_1263 [Leptospira santarosai str. 2000030832]|nr:hypothetical protein LEP1GSC040_1263 [Leptospira santarosai str. 2000030832]
MPNFRFHFSNPEIFRIYIRTKSGLSFLKSCKVINPIFGKRILRKISERKQ